MFFAELPTLFGRLFFLGYFLPITVFCAATLLLVSASAIVPEDVLQPILAAFAKENPWLTTTIATFTAWLLAVFLMSANGPITKFMEGYPLNYNWNPLKQHQIRRWRRLQNSRNALKAALQRCTQTNQSPAPELIARYMRVSKTLATELPDKEEWVLPTAFGNVIRAFEVYSRVMYGFDAIPGWERLLAVIPVEYRELIDNAKVGVDFWMNLWILSWLFFLENACFYLISEQLLFVSAAIVSAAVAWGCSRLARVAAKDWGEFIKASFDVFLPELQKKLALKDADDASAIGVWIRFTQRITYRMPGIPHNEPAANITVAPQAHDEKPERASTPAGAPAADSPEAQAPDETAIHHMTHTLLEAAIDPRSVRTAQSSGNSRTPITYGVYRLTELAPGGPSRIFRYGTHPVRQKELERQFGSVEVVAIYNQRDLAVQRARCEEDAL